MHAELLWFVSHTLQRHSPQPGDRKRSATEEHQEIYPFPQGILRPFQKSTASLSEFACLRFIVVVIQDGDS